MVKVCRKYILVHIKWQYWRILDSLIGTKVGASLDMAANGVGTIAITATGMQSFWDKYKNCNYYLVRVIFV